MTGNHRCGVSGLVILVVTDKSVRLLEMLLRYEQEKLQTREATLSSGVIKPRPHQVTCNNTSIIQFVPELSEGCSLPKQLPSRTPDLTGNKSV